MHKTLIWNTPDGCHFDGSPNTVRASVPALLLDRKDVFKVSGMKNAPAVVLAPQLPSPPTPSVEAAPPRSPFAESPPAYVPMAVAIHQPTPSAGGLARGASSGRGSVDATPYGVLPELSATPDSPFSPAAAERNAHQRKSVNFESLPAPSATEAYRVNPTAPPARKASEIYGVLPF